MSDVAEPPATQSVYGREAAKLTEPFCRGWTRRWSWRSPGAAGGAEEPLVDRVLRARGLTPATAQAFMEPKLTQLHDPSLMPGLDRAAIRLLEAARAGEAIVVYGDYDTDGVTATAILIHTLRGLAPECRISSYIPHRLEEGYGLNSEAIEELARGGAKVIVSVDCGVTAVEPALVAKRLGVDLIITDHHNPPTTLEQMPEAWAVVHPRAPGSSYPFGELSGAGVAYKLAWRLATLARGDSSGRVDGGTRELLVEMLAFAALGTIADVVPLVGENRVVARFGLGRIKHSPVIGLRALVEASGLDGEKVDAWDVAFKLAPRLNACGRLTHASAAVDLFTTNDPDRARTIAEELTQQNTRRRQVEQRILEQAVEQIEQKSLIQPERRMLVLSHPEWHAGVVGIVCSRLVERYGRPTILLCEADGESHGSGRSIDGFNLHGALESCAELMMRFGGHDMAAGLRLPTERVPELVRRLEAHALERISEDELTHRVELDAEAKVEELSPVVGRQFEQLGPFGRGNPTITLLLTGCILDCPPSPMGRGGEHLALMLRQPGGKRVLRVIAWKWGSRLGELSTGMQVDCVIRPKLSRWNGRETMEPELIDLRVPPRRG